MPLLGVLLQDIILWQTMEKLANALPIVRATGGATSTMENEIDKALSMLRRWKAFFVQVMWQLWQDQKLVFFVQLSVTSAKVLKQSWPLKGVTQMGDHRKRWRHGHGSHGMRVISSFGPSTLASDFLGVYWWFQSRSIEIETFAWVTLSHYCKFFFACLLLSLFRFAKSKPTNTLAKEWQLRSRNESYHHPSIHDFQRPKPIAAMYDRFKNSE